jgi:hypothetical protein
MCFIVDGSGDTLTFDISFTRIFFLPYLILFGSVSVFLPAALCL